MPRTVTPYESLSAAALRVLMRQRFPEPVDAGRAVAIAAARSNLLLFTIYTFPDYQVNWHHRYLASRLEDFARGRVKRLIVELPPRTGKSELVSRRLPAYILGIDPDARIIAASYGADLAQRMNRDVQRIMDAREYQELFPDTRLSGENIRTLAYGRYLRNSDLFEVVGRRGTYRGAGVGGGITGMGFDFGIIDDPVKDRAEADSLAYRDGVWEWYTSTFRSRREGSKTSILLTMTRWHEDDLVGRLLEQAESDPTTDQWEVVRLPALSEDDRADYDERTGPGQALWPAKFDEADLATTKATIGSYNFSALYQQRPAPAEGGRVKREWFRYWTPDTLPVPIYHNEYLQSWDMSFKDTDEADYVVGQVWMRSGANKYLMDQIRRRLDFPDTIREVIAFSQKWPQARLKLIEDKANGPAVISTLRRRVPGLVPVNPKGSKASRLNAVAADIESGNVYLPDPLKVPGAWWVPDFVEEWVSFPNAANDDQVDAGTQALQRLQGNSVEVSDDVLEGLLEVDR